MIVKRNPKSFAVKKIKGLKTIRENDFKSNLPTFGALPSRGIATKRVSCVHRFAHASTSYRSGTPGSRKEKEKKEGEGRMSDLGSNREWIARGRAGVGRKTAGREKCSSRWSTAFD